MRGVRKGIVVSHSMVALSEVHRSDEKSCEVTQSSQMTWRMGATRFCSGLQRTAATRRAVTRRDARVSADLV